MAGAIESGLLTETGGDAEKHRAEVEALRAEVAAHSASGNRDGADDAREKIVLHLVLTGDATGAIEAALDMVKKGSRERGRELCVRLFDALGANDPLAHASRRRLSNLWFV